MACGRRAVQHRWMIIHTKVHFLWRQTFTPSQSLEPQIPHSTVENSVFTAKDNWSTVALQKGKYWLCSMVWSLEAYLRRQDWLTACCTLRSKNPKNISATKTDDQNKWHNLFNVHQNSFMKLFRGKKGYGGPGLRTEMENKTERGSKERCWAKLHVFLSLLPYELLI